MQKQNVQKITNIVRKYFDDIKKIKYLFEVEDVSFNDQDNVWYVHCSIQNLFEKENIEYVVKVSDDGDILNVNKKDL